MHTCFLKESRKLCTYMSRQAPSEGDAFDADPIPFLPLSHQEKDEVDDSSQRGRTKSTGEKKPTVLFSNPMHSMTWKAADSDYQSSSTSGPGSWPRSQQPITTSSTMTALDDFVHPTRFMSTIPMALLEPTPILENRIQLSSDGSYRAALETDRNHVPATSSSYNGHFMDRVLSADTSVLDEPSIPLTFKR